METEKLNSKVNNMPQSRKPCPSCPSYTTATDKARYQKSEVEKKDEKTGTNGMSKSREPFSNAQSSRPSRLIMREAFPRVVQGQVKRDIPGFNAKN